MKPTIFWLDNFDKSVETITGSGSIHNTPGIAFQEVSLNTSIREELSISRSKRTSLPIDQEPPMKRFKIDPKKNPANFSCSDPQSSESKENAYFTKIFCLWKLLRKFYENDQLYSRFSGFVINIIQKQQEKTVITYLPPIETPITDYGTLFEMFHRSEQIAAQSNMKYTHITLDCGAAIKAYHVLWNNPDRYKHIIIHLGDFHLMQAFFGVIGSYISGSGFEDIIFQLGLCQPGTLKAVLKGKYYNQAWMIHESFAEAISRMFVEKCLPTTFLDNINTGIDIHELVHDIAHLKLWYKNTLTNFKRAFQESLEKRHNFG